MKNTTETKLTECPHCGSNYGFYRNVRMSGKSEYNYPFAGQPNPDNSQLHDCLRYIEGKRRYCCDCKKPLPIK